MNDQLTKEKLFFQNNQEKAQAIFTLNRVAAGIAIWSLGLGVALTASSSYADSDETNEIKTLPTITVAVQNGTLPEAYAGGQVATGSHVGFLGNKQVMDTPFNTISYTDEYINNIQAKDITDVIAATDPTVFTNKASGGWSENYYIRGFASSSQDMSINGLFGISPHYRTSPEMFERTEVFKGPSALLNGMPPNGSIGGTVNLVTKHASDTPLTRLTTTYMSDSQFGGHVDIGRRFGEDNAFGIRFNGVYRDGEGAIDDQDKSTEMYSLGLDWRGEKARLSADLYKSEDHVTGVTRGLNLAPGVEVPKPPKPDNLLNPNWGQVDTKDKGYIIRGEYDFNSYLSGYATYGQSKTDYQYNGAMTSTVKNSAGDVDVKIGQLAFDIDKQSADVGLRGTFYTGAVKHQWIVNSTYYQHDQNDYGQRNVSGAEFTTNIYNPVWGEAPKFVGPAVSKTALELKTYGIADTLSFLDDKIQFTAGVRRQEVEADTYDLKTGSLSKRYAASATTPAAALLFKASDQISIYGNYIEGLSQGATAPLTAVNAGEIFAPYKTKQKELGVKVDLGEFTHTLSVFEIKKPSSYTDPTTNVFSFGGEQRNRGAEWSFYGSPIENVRLMGGVAYIDPKVTKTAGGVNQGKQATAVPKQQAKLGAEWDVPYVENLTLTAGATAVSKQYISADNNLSVGGHTLYDIGARYSTKINNHPLTLRSTINNVTNKAYWGMPQLSSLTLGAPRTFMFSASFDF